VGQIGNLPSNIIPENSLSNGHYLQVIVFHVRRLPHYYCVDKAIFLTWRLYGSLPPGRTLSTCTFEDQPSPGQAFAATDRLLDSACSGPLYLRQPELAQMVVEAIRCRHGGPYRLHNYVVMANHVHLLITPEMPVSRLMQSLKRFTAREGNRILGSTGRPFWQDESYYRLVRDETEFGRIAHYIEMNPVRAGLVATPEEFPWSSAGRQINNLPHRSP
jgi:REP element-mobilizing transposase RayT